jgi:plasmid stabilization system protein ParE
MARVTFSPQARRDLADIVDFLLDFASPQTARKYEIEIRRVIDNLSDLPSIGSPRRVFGPNVRILIVRPFLIFYEDRSEQGEVEILRILHGSRDITQDLIHGGRT